MRARHHDARRPQGEHDETGHDRTVRVARRVDQRAGVVALVLASFEMSRWSSSSRRRCGSRRASPVDAGSSREQAEVAGLVAHLIDDDRRPQHDPEREPDGVHRTNRRRSVDLAGARRARTAAATRRARRGRARARGTAGGSARRTTPRTRRPAASRSPRTPPTRPRAAARSTTSAAGTGSTPRSACRRHSRARGTRHRGDREHDSVAAAPVRDPRGQADGDDVERRGGGLHRPRARSEQPVARARAPRSSADRDGSPAGRACRSGREGRSAAGAQADVADPQLGHREVEHRIPVGAMERDRAPPPTGWR